MGLGDIVRTKQPAPEIIYRALATGTPAPGNAAAFDANGLAILATASTDGPMGFFISGKDSTNVLKVSVGGTDYYAILMDGEIVTKSGGAIKPNKYVTVDANADVIAHVYTITTPTAAEVSLYFRRVGLYRKKESDNDTTPSDAADNDAIVVRVRHF